MSVLDSIIEGVKLDEANRRLSNSKLDELIAGAPKVRDAFQALSGPKFSIIAEIKRSSPSKGALAEIPAPKALGKIYEASGAAVVSVLTEERRFKGSLADFVSVRESIDIPMLRKDFMVSDYLIRESRAYGADLVLLIVAALDDEQLRDFYQIASELGMHSLIEIHDEVELERAMQINPKIVGVNSRNLKTLEVDRSTFARLLPRIPNQVIKVAESGISSIEDIQFAYKSGARAALVGEALVKADRPGEELTRLMASALA